MANTDTFDYKKNIPLMLVLLSGAFITILNQTLLGTALPPIMHDLQISENTVQWLQSIFMLVNGIMIPITAFLIDRFTTPLFFFSAMIVFIIFIFYNYIGFSFVLLLLLQILHISGAYIMIPFLPTIMLLIFSVDNRCTEMVKYNIVIALAPVIRPSL